MRPALEYIKMHCKKKRIVGAEVGVQCGENALTMLKEWEDVRKLHLVDSYVQDARAFLTAYKVTRPCGNRIEWHLMDSVEAAKGFKDKCLDFCYIDADHSYDSVKADIRAWKPKVKDGGYLCGHDYDSHLPNCDVTRAVHEIFNPETVGTGECDWWVQV